jgi:hypothetical protein
VDVSDVVKRWRRGVDGVDVSDVVKRWRCGVDGVDVSDVVKRWRRFPSLRRSRGSDRDLGFSVACWWRTVNLVPCAVGPHLYM